MKKITKTILAAACTVIAALGVAKAQAPAENPDTTQSTLARYGQELELLKRIKLSGYIQGQFQYIDSSGASSFAGGDFKPGVDKRFMLRRARLKAQYDGPINQKGWSTSQYVLQFDISEKGLTIKDVYAKFTDPWSGWFSLTTGMQNRPFGFEIGYSSGLRESPERGRMSQTIFPNERDLGAMATIQGPKTGNWNWIKLEAGMFNGTGGPGQGADASDFDKFKDLIGHLSMSKTFMEEKLKIGLGASYYYGGFRLDSANVKKTMNDSIVTESKAVDNFTSGIMSSRHEVLRKYMGVDAQVSFDWIAGITTVRGEYIQGDQPGFASSTKSPAAQPLDTKTSLPLDVYKRKFNGAYFYFLQNIMQTPLQLIFKYDWYDPNTDVKGDQIDTKKGFAKSNADLKYTTIGYGLAYRLDANTKITLYYDMVTNEKSANLSGYTKDLRDNVITARVQVKF